MYPSYDQIFKHRRLSHDFDEIKSSSSLMLLRFVAVSMDT